MGLTGQGPVGSAFALTDTVGTSSADPRLGQRFKDGDGNEYVVVDCQQAFVAGEWVFIDAANLAVRLNDSTQNGRVGIIMAAVSGSDTKAFAQIYGLYAGAPGTSAVATSKYLGVPTGSSNLGYVTAVNSSDAAGVVIYNAYAHTATDSATTSPASSFVAADGTSTVAIGFSVWLNYPYVVSAFIGATS